MYTHKVQKTVFFQISPLYTPACLMTVLFYKGHLPAWDDCLKVETWAPAPCGDWLSAIKLFSVRIRKILVIYQEGF